MAARICSTSGISQNKGGFIAFLYFAREVIMSILDGEPYQGGGVNWKMFGSVALVAAVVLGVVFLVFWLQKPAAPQPQPITEETPAATATPTPTPATTPSAKPTPGKKKR